MSNICEDSSNENTFRISGGFVAMERFRQSLKGKVTSCKREESRSLLEKNS